jgi:hypothetical protein
MVGVVGIHGDATAGIHAIGVNVNTPNAAAVAAAVAAATAGLETVVHIPNDKIFSIGMKSIMVATGSPDASTGILGMTCRLDGFVPKLHWQIAPFTAIAMD